MTLVWVMPPMATSRSRDLPGVRSQGYDLWTAARRRSLRDDRAVPGGDERLLEAGMSFSSSRFIWVKRCGLSEIGVVDRLLSSLGHERTGR